VLKADFKNNHQIQRKFQ